MRYSILVYVTGSFLRLSAFERTSNPIPLSMYIVQGNCEGIVGIIPVVGYFLIYPETKPRSPTATLPTAQSIPAPGLSSLFFPGPLIKWK